MNGRVVLRMHRKRLPLASALLLLGASSSLAADDRGPTFLYNSGQRLRMEIIRTESGEQELFQVKERDHWITVLSDSGSATRILAGAPSDAQLPCTVASVLKLPHPDRMVIRADCGMGTLERQIAATPDADVLEVTLRFVPGPTAQIHSVEDRYNFVPARRAIDSPTEGPVDFVWSQNLKTAADNIVPFWSFKSPTVMLQQDEWFAALIPHLPSTTDLQPALDLDVMSEAKPWIAYGAIPSEAYGHSYFRRLSSALLPVGKVIEYSYSITASVEPRRLGYRRVVRRLWSDLGRPQFLSSFEAQRNVRQPGLELFDDWRQEAWVRYANEVYRNVDCPGRQCSTLVSMRNAWGHWDQPSEDAWFNSWFQTLRTAYGWFLYGQSTNNQEIKRKAEGVLNLALESPQHAGAFPTIYLLPDHRWIPEDGWAGFSEDYHAFCMSWTAYWMLEWAKDLTPEKKDEILKFTRSYGDFLVRHQLATGLIPSWYDSLLQPRKEFGDFNAETAGSALFLLELGQMTSNQDYLAAGTRALEFITREVLPRQRWFDFETFLSCARKDFGFYDRFTAQYPQNNLSTMQAAMAYLKLYQISKEKKWLDLGTGVLDYLLLTQQVWNNPSFTPKLLGGFTTQNTDAEWSDARQSYAAVLLWDYYKETGESEYLERAVAAARATFAVAPWENWAHTGHKDEPGAMTGFHWGTGSAMTSVEILSASLGDAFIDVALQQGVGFNACSLRNLKVKGNSVSFTIDASPRLRKIRLKFSGVNPSLEYNVAWNGGRAERISGRVLASEGLVVEL